MRTRSPATSLRPTRASVPLYPIPDPPAEYRQVALALLDADEEGGRDPRARIMTLREKLYALHAPETLTEIVAIAVTCIALDGCMSPRTVYENLFSVAPSDRDWPELRDNWEEAHSG